MEQGGEGGRRREGGQQSGTDRHPHHLCFLLHKARPQCVRNLSFNLPPTHPDPPTPGNTHTHFQTTGLSKRASGGDEVREEEQSKATEKWLKRTSGQLNERWRRMTGWRRMMGMMGWRRMRRMMMRRGKGWGGGGGGGFG